MLICSITFELYIMFIWTICITDFMHKYKNLFDYILEIQNLFVLHKCSLIIRVMIEKTYILCEIYFRLISKIVEKFYWKIKRFQYLNDFP